MTSRPLWQDESSLLANMGLSWGIYFGPLPFHDQAAPPLALIVINLLWAAGGGDVETTRFLLLCMTATCLALAGHLCRIRRKHTLLFGISLLMLLPETVIYATEIKHYILEMQACLLLIVFSACLDLKNRAAPALFVAASLLACLFSFSSMLVSGCLMAEIILFRSYGRFRLRWIAWLGVFGACWLALYALLFRETLVYQMSNYAMVYKESTLLSLLQQAPSEAGKKIFFLFKPINLPLFVVIIAVATATLRLRKDQGTGRRPEARSRPLFERDEFSNSRMAMLLLSAIVLASLAGQYPLSSQRQTLFILVPFVMMFMETIIAIHATASTRRIAAIAIIICFSSVMIDNARTIIRGKYIQQDTRSLYKFLLAHRQKPVVPSLLFDPTLHYYETRNPGSGLTILGSLSPASAFMPSNADVVTGLQSGNVTGLGVHIWYPLDLYGSFRTYTNWVLGIARQKGEILFAVAQFKPEHQEDLLRSAALADCSATVAFQARGVAAYDLKCP
ncbi:hypothetical protein [Rhizobium sp. CSW-27]|uniref:hypothetical protein n=1 Tax=Rhizobium sp. CSW-27 TaxID=2839985 RepID=UPI001C03446C|nr:hypothetical protein [Rhizobium sp. CSW-27]MBT9371473.1 hypothetical protein [Rhizobium sp. CSW-27]